MARGKRESAQRRASQVYSPPLYCDCFFRLMYAVMGRLITQQAVISMETARLYQSREEEVMRRTELWRKATQEAKEANQSKSLFLASVRMAEKRGAPSEAKGER
jgi:hypothetical protein